MYEDEIEKYRKLVIGVFEAIKKHEDSLGRRLNMAEVNAIADPDPIGLSATAREVHDAVLALERERMGALDNNNRPLLRAYDQILERVKRPFQRV